MFDANIGKHCKICKRKDYLPFECEHCNEWHCSEHRSYLHHECSNAPHQKPTKPTIPDKIKITKTKKSKKCIKCKEPQIVPNKCTICNHTVCMMHRYRDQHRCIPPQKQKNIIEPKSTFINAIDDIRNYIMAH
jgi:AN1-type zinc finger protein 1